MRVFSAFAPDIYGPKNFKSHFIVCVNMRRFVAGFHRWHEFISATSDDKNIVVSRRT